MNPLDPIEQALAQTLFFRPADRQLLHGCVQAVAQEGKCVLLHSPSPGVLDHYGQSLVNALRQRLPDTHTEIFFPAHSEALIARFNELLQSLSVDDATQNASTEAPLKLWVVHDANALPEHELKLLVRLLQQFPGARLAALLMLTELPDWLRPIDPQGKRLHRWSAEPPSVEQAQAMVEGARAQGREALARELVARAVMPPPVAPPSVTLVRAPAPVRPAPPELRAAPEDHPLPAAAAPGRRGRAVAMGLLLLLVSAGITAWLQPQATRALWQTLTQTTPAVPVGEAPATSANSPTPDSSSPAAAASEPASAPTPEASAPAVAQTEAPAPAPAASSPAPAAPAEAVVTELPDLAVKGLAWVKGLPADTLLVRHSRWPTAAQARKTLGTGPLANARVVPHYPSGADKAEFWVVVGPFRSEERARNHILKNSWSQAAVVSRSNALERARPSSPSENAR